MSGHTPGPWIEAEGDDSGIDIQGDGYTIATAWSGLDLVNHPDEAVMKANARLIASSPDLLDALRAFCGDYESTPTTSDTGLKAAYLHALAVIAKAEGGQ